MDRYREIAPQCFCENGKMQVKVASRKAANPGRLYYICPNNDDHYDHFIWCDEYLARPRNFIQIPNQFRREVHHQDSNNASSHVTRGQAAVHGTHGSLRRQIYGEVEMYVALGFMATVLVLFGVMIGIILMK